MPFWKKLLYTEMFLFCSVADASLSAGIRDQRVWGIKECAKVFGESIGKLRDELNKQGDGGMLVWDKVRLFKKKKRKNIKKKNILL